MTKLAVVGIALLIQGRPDGSGDAAVRQIAETLRASTAGPDRVTAICCFNDLLRRATGRDRCPAAARRDHLARTRALALDAPTSSGGRTGTCCLVPFLPTPDLLRSDQFVRQDSGARMDGAEQCWLPLFAPHGRKTRLPPENPGTIQLLGSLTAPDHATTEQSDSRADD